MKADEIIALAKETRTAQKKYFATRSNDWLTKCKELERRLDLELSEYEGGQGKLFDSAAS